MVLVEFGSTLVQVRFKSGSRFVLGGFGRCSKDWARGIAVEVGVRDLKILLNSAKCFGLWALIRSSESRTQLVRPVYVIHGTR
jgi:acyl CoA:acetate/3-ketoacid CoA transferase alpha subunit